MRTILFTFLCLGVLGPVVFNQDKGWRGIVPLHSTRLDVEKLIGPPNTPNGSMYDPGNLDLTVDRIFVEYSTGHCAKERKGGYDVPSGTVIRLFITWSKKPDFCELRIDESKFEKTLDAELPGLVHYLNMEEGIEYTVEDGKLKRTQYFSSKKDSHLKCPRN